MNVRRVKKGEVIARCQDKVLEWYLIQEGTVAQQFDAAELVMERNSIIGLLEVGWFICDYVAKEDCTLIVIEGKNAQDLSLLLGQHENFRGVFLRSALEQKYKTVALYQTLNDKAKKLHSFAQRAYQKYLFMCAEALLEPLPFSRMDSFEPLTMLHRTEDWEIESSNALVKRHLKEYMVLMVKEDALCVGAIMETAAQMRRITQGIDEIVGYLEFNKEIMWAESENDIFHLYLELAVRMSKQKQDYSQVMQEIEKGVEEMEKLGIYTDKQLASCRRAFENYDFSAASEGRVNVLQTDCVQHIMEYADMDQSKIDEMKNLLEIYSHLSEQSDGDNDAFRIRKQITNIFYTVYEAAFLRAIKSGEKISPILQMFFHFGFMDVDTLGDELTNAVYNLTDHLSLFQSENVYTVYSWLESIYRGKKEPSRNEFDMDYRQSLVDLRRQGEITEEEMEALKTNQEEKVKFEIQNMFRSAHRMTYGRVTTFCPVLSKEEFINSVEKMALTAEKIKTAMNKVREVDYSILYREVLFSDVERGIKQEWIQKEVLPDVILMPDAGTKGAMWQETSGAKVDTPARFMFPIFTAIDMDEQMVEIMARYRWEITRRIQGVYWNDIREKSLTAEYYDYLQFYRKNSELTTDGKEKVKIALSRARNNYREVFVKDYVSWLKYESKGSFRLNKVARGILTRYCPFNKEIRKELKSNPVYQNAFNKMEIENQGKIKRFAAIYDKYEEAGGEITEDLKNNFNFYQM